MKIHFILLFTLFLIAGCSQHSYRLETQVVRFEGGLKVLSVISESDVKGIMSIQEKHSQVTFSYGKGNDVVIDPIQINIQGELWGEIPEETQKVLIQYYDSKFNVQLDPEA